MVTAPSLRIVYFGTPEFAVPPLTRLLASRHRVVAVVSQPDRPRGRGHRLTPTATKRTATEARVPVLQPDRIRAEAFLREVATLSPELGVVDQVFFDEGYTSFNKPAVILNVAWYLQHRYRTGAEVSQAVPYVVLGFAFQSDLLSGR